MLAVMRRSAPIVVLLLLLTACSGADRVSIEAGEDSLTREELIAVVNVFNGVSNDQGPVPTVLSRDLRERGTQYLRSLTFLDFFEAQPGGVPDGLAGEMSDIVIEATNAEQIPQLGFESMEREAIVTILMASALLSDQPIGSLSPAGDQQFPGQLPILQEFGGDFTVESRLGSWDEQTFSIVGP